MMLNRWIGRDGYGWAAASRGLLTLCLVACAAVGAAVADDQPVWELSPYRVRVFVRVGAGADLAAVSAATLSARLTERLGALAGGAWDVTAAPATAELDRAMAASLAGVTADGLPKESLAEDKVLLLAVSATAGGCEAAAREFDVRTGVWSGPVARTVVQPAKIADAAIDAIVGGFAPLARVSRVKDAEVLLRLRASAVGPRDPGLAAGKPGSVFRLVSRSLAGESRPGTPLPWTFCVVEQATDDGLRCRLETGLHDPLAGRWESSLEVLALGATPSAAGSVLAVQSTADPPQPVAGCQVYVSAGGAQRPVLLGSTDRAGLLELPPTHGRLEVLWLQGGGDWLARLPVVPGLEPRLTVQVADGGHRAGADGVIAGIGDALVDLAGRREVLAARLKARVEAGRLADAEPLLKELMELPAAQDVAKSRAGELTRGVALDAAAQARIDAAVAEMLKVADAQFDLRAIQGLAEKLHPSKPTPKKP